MRTGEWTPGAKTLVLTLDGVAVTEDVVSLSYTDDLNGEEDPKIGSTCAAVLTMTVQKPAHNYAGKTLSVSVGGIPLGVFTVTTVERKDERAVITAMDAMAAAFQDEFTPASTSSTALTVIRAVCAAAGIAVGDVSDVTDVPVTGLTAGHTGREMIGLMAALLGRNAHIDREGRLCLRWYASGGVTVTADDYYPGDLTKEDADYEIGRIECTVRKSAVSSEEAALTVYTAGTGATGISITDEYMTQAILDGVYQQIGGMTYRPLAVTFYGDARIETGDILMVTDAAGASYRAPVMKVVHVWDGGVKTTVTAYGKPGEGLSRSPAGALSKSVSNLMAEFARFQTLEADEFRAVRAEIQEIEAGTLIVRDVNGKILFQADKDTRIVQIGGLTAAYDRTFNTLYTLDGSCALICRGEAYEDGFDYEDDSYTETEFISDGMAMYRGDENGGGRVLVASLSSFDIQDLTRKQLLVETPQGLSLIFRRVQNPARYLSVEYGTSYPLSVRYPLEELDAVLSGLSALQTRFPTSYVSNLNSVPYGNICLLETDGSTLNTPYAAGLSSWTMGAVISYCTSANYGTQVYFSRAAREVFIRRLYEGAWSAWIKIPTENDLAPSSVTVTDVNVYGRNLQVNRIGRHVTVSGWVRPKAQAYTAVSTALVKLGTAPAERTFFVGSGNGTTYGMELTAAGNVVFNSSSPTFSGNPYIYFNFSYITP